MYWRAYICAGDTITPGGGIVQPAPQIYPITYHGKNACFEGDPVYCNTCKSWGKTKCVAPLQSDTASDGRQANLDGDLCLCKCPVPPRLKALSQTDGMGFDGVEVDKMAGVLPWLVSAGHLGNNFIGNKK